MTMLNWNTVMQASLLGMVIVASWQDMKFRIISNRLVLTGALMGLGFATTPNAHGIGSAFVSSILVFMSFLALHLAGWLGAGDVKLAAAAGTYFPASEALILSLIIMITGGLVCLFWSAWPWTDKRKGIPYAVSIGLGVLLYLWSRN
jgi:prepilin peptidase CpaA